jgi:cytochrome c
VRRRRAALLFSAIGWWFAASAAGPDGARLFQRCYACHSVEPGETGLPGPNLAGVVGRRAAAGEEEFEYSAAARAAGTGGLVWDAPSLDAFLADPAGFLPGTLMSFPGMRDAAERAAVIEFLAAPERRGRKKALR